MSQLNDHERRAIDLILGRLPTGVREKILLDLEGAVVEVINRDRSILRFHIPGYGGAKSVGQQPLGVEGKVRDQDGELLDVVIYQDANDRLFEFELVRYALGEVIGPDWPTFTIAGD